MSCSRFSSLTRRQALTSGLTLGAAALATGPGGCRKPAPKVGLVPPAHGTATAPPNPSSTVSSTPTPRAHTQVDLSFAQLALEYQKQPTAELQAQLLAHPALAAVQRHSRLVMSRLQIDRSKLLANLLDQPSYPEQTGKVRAHWQPRKAALQTAAKACLSLLPDDVSLRGTTFFGVNYDLGVAAPPDIVLNAAHEHFRSRPEEIEYYATHEWHHVGFMPSQPMPRLTGLYKPSTLRRVIKYFTQLEGMAVHAAYAGRKRGQALATDADYIVYLDSSVAESVVARYRQLLQRTESQDELSETAVGKILEAMSSSERLWYRFGALVAWTIEERNDRETLARTVNEPWVFYEKAAELLAGKLRWPAP